jgi:hypothetical protein
VIAWKYRVGRSGSTSRQSCVVATQTAALRSMLGRSDPTATRFEPAVVTLNIT